MFKFKKDEVVLDTEIDKIRKVYIYERDRIRKDIYHYVKRIKVYRDILSLFNKNNLRYKEIENEWISYKHNLEKCIDEYKRISEAYEIFNKNISDSMLNTTKGYGDIFTDYIIVLEEALKSANKEVYKWMKFLWFLH